MAVLVQTALNQYVTKTNLAAAVAAADSANRTIVVTGAETVSASLTIPVTRALRVEKGATITIASGQTLTINGSFNAGLYQCFAGSGTVAFASTSVREVFYEWFAGTTYTGDQTAAFTSAANATRTAGAALILPPTTLLVGPYDNDEITTMLSIVGMELRGVPGQTTLKFNWAVVDTSANTYQFLVGGTDTIVTGVIFDGDKATLGWATDDATKSCNCLTNAVTAGISYNVIMEDVEFINLPGTTAKESFSFGIHNIHGGYFKNIVHRNCNTTFHIPGGLHLDADVDDNWAKDIVVQGFRVWNTAGVDLGWMGFGTYGCKNLKVSDLHVEGCYYNGINLEWLIDATITGASAYNCGVSGLSTYAYQENVDVVRPVFSGNGWNTAETAERSTIRVRASSWWTAGIYAAALKSNPVSLNIYKPHIIDESTSVQQNVYFLISNTNLLMPAGWTTRPISVKIIPESGQYLTFKTNTSSTSFVYPGVSFCPELATPAITLMDAIQGTMTVTVETEAGEVYDKIVSTTQYQAARVLMHPGTYAVSFKTRVAETGDWRYKISNVAGTVNDIFIAEDTSESSSDGWRDNGFIVCVTEADSSFSFMTETAGSVNHELHIKDLRIVQLTVDDGYPMARYDNAKRTFKSKAIPTAGYYAFGEIVEHNDAGVTGSGTSDYVVIGWYRLTTGSAHVLNTDWAEMRVLTGT